MTDAPPDAPANATRPRRTITWQRKISATRTVKEERVAFGDAALIDIMHANGMLSDGQYSTGCQLLVLFSAAQQSRRITPDYGVLREDQDDDGVDGDDSDDDPDNTPEQKWRRLMIDLGSERAGVVDSLMRNTLPVWMHGKAGRILDAIAAIWRQQMAERMVRKSP